MLGFLFFCCFCLLKRETQEASKLSGCFSKPAGCGERYLKWLDVAARPFGKIDFDMFGKLDPSTDRGPRLGWYLFDTGSCRCSNSRRLREAFQLSGTHSRGGDRLRPGWALVR